MLTLLHDSQLPSSLRGALIVDDEHKLPRYWASVWDLMSSSELAESSRIKRLRHVENLYSHADRMFGAHALDDALGGLDDVRLAEILESWFVSIRNQAIVSSADELRWRTGLSFVSSVAAWLSKSTLPTERLKQIESRLHRLSHLYGQLHVRKPRQMSQLRSLPASVVEALYEMLDPSSASNPFSRTHTRWLAFMAFLLMLHQGLRRGEVLLLTADVVKSGFDERQQRPRYWLNVQESKYSGEEDPRYSRPSIKTANSVRQLPVSSTISGLIQAYVENHRGSPNHHQLLDQSDPMDEALQKLRAFFGWSKDSQMPVRYARAVFEDRLASVWAKDLDDRASILSAIPL